MPEANWGSRENIRFFGDNIAWVRFEDDDSEELVVEDCGPNDPSLHEHRVSTESFMVVRGLYEFSVGGEKKILGPGDTVTIPPGTEHGFRRIGEVARGSHITIVQCFPPFLASMFRAVAELETEGVNPEEFGQRVQKIFHDHGQH